ncbi:MAG: NAD(P)-binding domain-containing protein, partial [Jiangellaceae bacterium]
MTTRVQTLIVGAGQAGLATSRWLTDLGQEHLVLERGNIAERWRSERWDSFRLLTPNWQTRLPGHAYDGPDPDGFMSGSEVVLFFDDYARSFGAEVRAGVTVTSAVSVEDGWHVHAGDEVYVADNVVVATGHYDRPAVPTIANGDLGEVQQLHSATYRNPDQLDPGAVLVVGSGPSGQQIADELALAGREVHLAVGRH